MVEFLQAGGPIMILLLATSVMGLAFILERGLALRWNRVIPPSVEDALAECRTPEDVPRLKQFCNAAPSSLSRLLLSACEHLRWPKAENSQAVEIRARHEMVHLERGLVVLEIVVGIAPLLGLIGTIHGLIALFGDMGQSGMADNIVLARGIAIALNTTFVGLLIAIPALIAWSYYNKKVERFAVEMERLCDDFLRRVYRRK
jgi:biopolymer transport protein ExbB